jgi:hypothetical protein
MFGKNHIQITAEGSETLTEEFVFFFILSRRILPEPCILSVGSEVLTAVAMKTTIFWPITPCSPLKVSRRFRGTYRLHLQGQRISRARNQRESRRQAAVFCDVSFLVDLFFDPEYGGYIFLRNVG